MSEQRRSRHAGHRRRKTTTPKRPHPKRRVEPQNAVTRTSVWSISCSCASSLALSSRLQTLWNSLRAAFVSSQPAPSRPAEPRATRPLSSGWLSEQTRHSESTGRASKMARAPSRLRQQQTRSVETTASRAQQQNEAKPRQNKSAEPLSPTALGERAPQGAATESSIPSKQHGQRKAPAAKQNRSQTVDPAALRGTHIASGRRRSCPPHRPGTGRLPSPTARPPS